MASGHSLSNRKNPKVRESRTLSPRLIPPGTSELITPGANPCHKPLSTGGRTGGVAVGVHAHHLKSIVSGPGIIVSFGTVTVNLVYYGHTNHTTVYVTVTMTGPARIATPGKTRLVLDKNKNDKKNDIKENDIIKVATIEEFGVAHVVVEGIAKDTEVLIDLIPVNKASGDGAATPLEDGIATVLRKVIALSAHLIGYVTGSIIVDGVETSTYRGADIANTNGEGPEISAKEG